MLNRKLIVTALSLAAVSTTFAAAQANTSASNSHQGYYVAVDGGIANYTADFISYNQFAYGAHVGYQFNKNIALELGALRLPNTKSFGQINSKNHFLIDVALKGILPLSTCFDIYGKLGVGYGQFTAVNNQYETWLNTHPHQSQGIGLIGVGAEYAFTPKVSLGVEADATAGSGSYSQFHMFLASLAYHFK